MRKYIPFLFLTVSLFAANLTSQIKSDADAEAASIITSIASAQATYLQTHSECWIGASSHSTTPADGSKTAPDNAAYAAFGITLPATMIQAIRVDNYSGGGYQVVQLITYSGHPWSKCTAYGPEAVDRSHDWFQEDLK